jgi:GAF domain-containing protein
MHETLSDITNLSKEERYKEVLISARGLIDPNCSDTANLANISALLKTYFNFWWCGFYLVNDKQQLELGPFQGPVACTLIQYGKGVCGTSWQRGETIIVPNVHEFEGHIACSSASNSEIVVPLFRDNKVIGVLDIDSEHFNHFDEMDKHYLEALVKLF